MRMRMRMRCSGWCERPHTMACHSTRSRADALMRADALIHLKCRPNAAAAGASGASGAPDLVRLGLAVGGGRSGGRVERHIRVVRFDDKTADVEHCRDLP